MPSTKPRPVEAPATSVELSDAELNRRVLKRARAMTPAEWLALSVAVGVHNPDGTLTPEYGGEPARKRRDN